MKKKDNKDLPYYLIPTYLDAAARRDEQKRQTLKNTKATKDEIKMLDPDRDARNARQKESDEKKRIELHNWFDKNTKYLLEEVVEKYNETNAQTALDFYKDKIEEFKANSDELKRIEVLTKKSRTVLFFEELLKVSPSFAVLVPIECLEFAGVKYVYNSLSDDEVETLKNRILNENRKIALTAGFKKNYPELNDMIRGKGKNFHI